jgi:predicted Zn-dependent protease
MDRRITIRTLILFILITCVFHGACVKNPVTGARQLTLISESQEGTQLLSGRDERINGNQAFLGLYRVQSESGNIGVTAAFISHGGHIYQVAGLAPESTFSRYSRSLDAIVRSFRELTDPGLLAAQPDQMKMYRARRGETLRSLTKSMDQTRVKLEDLVRVNRIEPDQTLSAGTWVKLVQLGNR